MLAVALIALVTWGVANLTTLVRAWRAGVMPEAEWFAIRVAIWGCVVAAAAIIGSRTKRAHEGGSVPDSRS